MTLYYARLNGRDPIASHPIASPNLRLTDCG